jgi:iron complex outermembrane receptor protein
LFKPIRLLSSSLIALAVASAIQAQDGADAAGAAAQTSESSEDSVLADIVITATRQETSLQSTPIAITAVSSEELAKRSITNTAELGAIVPNATFRQAQGAFGKAVTAFIRGIGQGDSNLASEPGVAYYIDDVYYPLLFGSMFDIVDLDHVEVLRGPQGTLFGRNALAGAINLVSKAPDLESTSAYAEATAGQFDRFDVRAGFNLPLGQNMAVRISGAAKKRHGYQKRLDFRCEMIRRGTPELAGNFPYAEGLLFDTDNYTPDSCVIGYLGGEDVHAVRGQLLWRPSDRFSLTISGDYTRDESENTADQLIAVNATTANANANLRNIAAQYTAPGGPTFAYDERFVTGDPYTTYATYGDPTPAGAVVPGTTFYNGSVLRGGLRYRPFSPMLNWGYSMKIVYGLTDDIDLTIVGGYRKVDTVFSFDVDGSPLAMENTRNNTGEDHTSGEIRLSGETGPLSWVGGLFYYRGHGYVHTALVSPYNNIQRYQNNIYEPDSKAVFANVTWRPLERLGITLGGRYSDDEKPVSYSNLLDGSPSGNIIFNVTPGDERFDWKAGVDYQFGDATMVYASAATGFRLPSFNSRPLQPTQVGQVPGDEIQSYELGIKTDLFSRRVRLNANLFYTDYKTRPAGVSGQEYLLGPDGQPVPGQQVTIPHPTAGAGATTCRTLTQEEIDAGTPGFQCIGRTYFVNMPGEVKGIEAEIEAHPWDRFSFNASLGYADFSSPDLEVPTRANKRLTGIPEWTASAGVQYEWLTPGLNGSITPRLDAFYQGSIVYSAVSRTYNQNPYTVVNGRVTYLNDNGDVSIAVGVTNLFNKFYYRNFFIFQELGFPNVNAQPSPPREWFVTIRKNF